MHTWSLLHGSWRVSGKQQQRRRGRAQPHAHLGLCGPFQVRIHVNPVDVGTTPYQDVNAIRVALLYGVDQGSFAVLAATRSEGEQM